MLKIHYIKKVLRETNKNSVSIRFFQIKMSDEGRYICLVFRNKNSFRKHIDILVSGIYYFYIY